MNGINAHTGKALSGYEHLRQSVADILRTRIGTRVMRRDYGSRLATLVDQPMTPAWRSECYAAVAEALDQWEPRYRLTRVQLVSVSGGQVTFDIEGEYRADGTTVHMEGLVI